MRRFFRHHGLSVVMLGLLFVTFLVGQVVSGRNEYNDDREKPGMSQVGYTDYMRSPHFAEATAENWESEFLSIGAMVLLTIWLREANSPESKEVATPYWENEE